MSDSDESTLPNTPPSFSEDVLNEIEDHVFALLKPLNPDAHEAFDAAVNTVIKHPDTYKHARQYLHSNPRSARAASIFTNDGTADSEPESTYQWNGGFKFSLKIPPRTPGEGWFLGTERGRPTTGEVDILLAPPTQRWAKEGIAGRHARIYFHRESCRIIIEARHSVTLGGAKKADVFTKLASRALEQGQLVSIGGCLYVFEYTGLFTSPLFLDELSIFMKDCYGPQWMFHKMISPASGGDFIALGNYTCTPGAFAQGTFGQVTAGWARDGTVVAIKRFKIPNQTKLDTHREMMAYIGKHDNILTLLDCIVDFNVELPGAYCVYTPLAVGSLKDVIELYRSDLSAQLTLLVDYLKGLTYLHGEKGVMHRDINPSNLGVTFLNPPQGIILDLDSATRSELSEDHMQGTMMYLAPEIIDLKSWDGSTGRTPKPEPFGRDVDVWALGLSAFAAYLGRSFSWKYFGPVEHQYGYVEKHAYQEYRDFIHGKQNSEDHRTAQLLRFIEDMTAWYPRQRVSAAKVLVQVQSLIANQGKGLIEPKAGPKRGMEE